MPGEAIGDCIWQSSISFGGYLGIPILTAVGAGRLGAGETRLMITRFEGLRTEALSKKKYLIFNIHELQHRFDLADVNSDINHLHDPNHVCDYDVHYDL